VVVLGRIALHTADQRQTELTAAIARVMLRSGVPGIERHAAWLLAQQAQAGGDPAQARRWLTAQGETERLCLFPLFPLDPADDPQLVRIALASGDRELAEAATAGAERRAEVSPAVPAVLASAVHARGLLTGNIGLLAQAVMSIPAVKAVAIGAGAEASALPGSEVHDEIAYNSETKDFIRATNRAGRYSRGLSPTG